MFPLLLRPHRDPSYPGLFYTHLPFTCIFPFRLHPHTFRHRIWFLCFVLDSESVYKSPRWRIRSPCYFFLVSWEAKIRKGVPSFLPSFLLLVIYSMREIVSCINNSYNSRCIINQYIRTKIFHKHKIQTHSHIGSSLSFRGEFFWSMRYPKLVFKKLSAIR